MLSQEKNLSIVNIKKKKKKKMFIRARKKDLKLKEKLQKK